MGIGAVGYGYGVKESMIRFVKRNEDQIWGSGKASAASSVYMCYVRHRDPVLEKVEGPCVYGRKTQVEAVLAPCKEWKDVRKKTKQFNGDRTFLH